MKLYKVFYKAALKVDDYKGMCSAIHSVTKNVSLTEKATHFLYEYLFGKKYPDVFVYYWVRGPRNIVTPNNIDLPAIYCESDDEMFFMRQMILYSAYEYCKENDI